jgi:hypothetical protein
LKRGVVGDGARDVLGVAPVDAEPEPVGDGLVGSFVTKMTEIKFELAGLAICPSLLKQHSPPSLVLNSAQVKAVHSDSRVQYSKH